MQQFLQIFFKQIKIFVKIYKKSLYKNYFFYFENDVSDIIFKILYINIFF